MERGWPACRVEDPTKSYQHLYDICVMVARSRTDSEPMAVDTKKWTRSDGQPTQRSATDKVCQQPTHTMIPNPPYSFREIHAASDTNMSFCKLTSLEDGLRSSIRAHKWPI